MKLESTQKSHFPLSDNSQRVTVCVFIKQMQFYFGLTYQHDTVMSVNYLPPPVTHLVLVWHNKNPLKKKITIFYVTTRGLLPFSANSNAPCSLHVTHFRVCLLTFLIRKKKKKYKESVWNRCSFPLVAFHCVKAVQRKHSSHPQQKEHMWIVHLGEQLTADR